MKNSLQWITFFAMIFLSGCTGPQASTDERFHDAFLFTAANNVSSEEVKCFTLTKPYLLKSGSVTFSIPAGQYIAQKKNKTGYFYYAPTSIKSSNRYYSVDQEGIYLDNSFKKANLFWKDFRGYDDKPIRGVILPADIFSYIKMKSRC